MRHEAKFLLLSDIPPCKNYTAGIVLDQLVRFVDPGNFACYIVRDRDLPDADLSDDLKGLIPCQFETRPGEHAWRKGPGKLGTLTGFLREWYVENFVLPRIIRGAVAFGKSHEVKAVWAVLEGQTMIRIARRTAELLEVPLLTEVWDPPTWWLRDRHIDRFSQKRILAEFWRAIQASRACAVASIPMAEHYKKKTGVECIPFLPAVDETLISKTPRESRVASETFTIVVAGQLYASQEWRSLLSGLDLLNWKVGERQVRIKMLGRSLHLHTDKAAHITYLGWRSQSEVVAILSEADLAYCPYWFDPVFKDESTLSFPSKLTSYLAAGIPVLFHGPEYASPSLFLKEHRAGYVCNSLDPKDTAEKIAAIALASDQEISRISQNGLDVCSTMLSLTALKRSFLQFLDYGDN